MLAERKEKVNADALNDFIEMILNSWTYDRMTKAERENAVEVLRQTQEFSALKGTYRARFQTLHAVYNAYLIGIGYNSFNWREPAEASAQF